MAHIRGDARDNRHLSVLNPLDPNVLHHHANRSTHGNLPYVCSAPLYRLPGPAPDRALKHARFEDKSQVLATSTVSVSSSSRGATELPEPSAPPPLTVLGPLPISQNQLPQFQYLQEYDWTPTSSALSYLPLFTPTDHSALPLPGVSRSFSSHGPTSQSPFPLLGGAGLFTIHPDSHTATLARASIDPQKEMACEPSAPPPSIRKSSRLRTGERGSDRDSTGDDPDTIEDVPAAVVADASVSRIRRTWASIYEDEVLTSDDRTLPAAKRRRIYILSLERYINVIQYCLERNNMVVVVASASGRDTFRTVGAKKSKLTLAAFQKDLSTLRKRLAHVYSEIDRLRDRLQPNPMHQVHQGYHYPNHGFHP